MSPNTYVTRGPLVVLTIVHEVNVAFAPLGDDQSLMTIELSLLPPGRFDEFQDGWSLTCDQLAALLHWLLIHGRGTGEVQRLGCDYARVCRVPNPVSHSQLR